MNSSKSNERNLLTSFIAIIVVVFIATMLIRGVIADAKQTIECVNAQLTIESNNCNQ